MYENGVHYDIITTRGIHAFKPNKIGNGCIGIIRKEIVRQEVIKCIGNRGKAVSNSPCEYYGITKIHWVSKIASNIA